MQNFGVKEIFDKGLFKGEVKFDEPMSAHTSLRIGGPVEIMAFPEDPVSLKNLLLTCSKEKIPVFILGAGTNLLAGDKGVKGIAISLRAFRKIEVIKETDDNKVVIFVEAGVLLGSLLNYAKRYGYSGIEALAGIPGTFGGAVCMNAGSFGVEIKDILCSLVVMDKEGRINILQRDELKFSYRSSNLPDNLIVLSANILLKKDAPGAVKKRAEEFLHKRSLTQPIGQPSAGCIFKNPEGEIAGRLIDAAGCKGMRIGDVEVSERHANYFVNKGKANCRDFVRLMATVREKVREYSGVMLEPEIKIVGEN